MRKFLMSMSVIVVAAQFVLAQGSAPEIEMVRVRGGSFRMGCPGEGIGCLADERPIHEVRLSDFHISKYPVTQAQWVAVMGSNPSYFQGDENRPVEQVSWNDVQEFITRLNAMTGRTYRLPTEAEWEFAASGGMAAQRQSRRERRAAVAETMDREFLDEFAWYSLNSGGTTHPVGQKKPNELNLYDMQGNVWEWVYDRYDRNFYRNPPLRNPRNSRTGEDRVMRGHSFMSEERHFRPSVRNYNQPNYRAIYLGFRLAM